MDDGDPFDRQLRKNPQLRHLDGRSILDPDSWLPLCSSPARSGAFSFFHARPFLPDYGLLRGLPRRCRQHCLPVSWKHVDRNGNSGGRRSYVLHWETDSYHMTPSRSTAHSPYMEWAKLYSTAKFNLATSGVASFPLSELGVTIDQLEINGPSIDGYEPLLQAIARRNRVPQECVVSAVGTSLANYLALAATTEPGDEILVEQPTYELLLSTAKYLGLEIKRFPRRAENNFAIDPADVERNLTPRTRLIVICNLHNPTVALAPDATLREVGKLAAKVGARVLVDEVYREMLFEPSPASAFHINPERFIVTNSLTKAY